MLNGQGNFRGTREQTFNILPRNIRDAEVELVQTKYKYTGYQIEPVLNVWMSKIGGQPQEKVTLIVYALTASLSLASTAFAGTTDSTV